MKTTCDAPWALWHPSEAEPWDVRRVVHLRRRAGFGATWGEIQRDLKEGPEPAIQRLLEGRAREEGVPEEFARMAETIGNAAVAAGSPERLKAWWVYRMLFSPDPLTERLTLMWHNHFATSNLKVDDVALMLRQNEIFRRHCRARFAELLPRVAKDPAMLVWLDAEANRKEHPNENLARELMELFTLGVGNFTEDDVKEAARALTGWTVVRGNFRRVEQYHDGGLKTILGRTGRFNGDDLIAILLEHPATARRIAWRVCNTFLGEGAFDETMIEQLAQGLQENDLDVNWAIETVLRSRIFFSEGNIGNRVLGPAAFIIGAVRALDLFDPPPSTLLLAEQMRRLGQDLFYPPNVFGWGGGRTWINSRSLIGRGNFAVALVQGRLRTPKQSCDALGLARRHGFDSSHGSVALFFAQLLTGRALSESLTEQLHNLRLESSPLDADAVRLIVSAILASPEAQLG